MKYTLGRGDACRSESVEKLERVCNYLPGNLVGLSTMYVRLQRCCNCGILTGVAFNHVSGSARCASHLGKLGFENSIDER